MVNKPIVVKTNTLVKCQFSKWNTDLTGVFLCGMITG